MLEKIFITKNFSQFKTSHTSKIDVFRTTDNKNIGNMFSKYELFLLDQAYSSSDLSQILILRFPIFRASLPPSPSLPNFQPTEAPLHHNPPHVLRQIPYFVLPYLTTHHDKYWLYQTMRQAKQIKFMIKLYTDDNNLWIKHVTHQKAEPLRAASLSKLESKVNNHSIFNTKYSKFSTKWQLLLQF